MSTSATQIATMIELAKKKYYDKDCSERDLLQCESIFLEGLEVYTKLYGADSEHAGWMHCWLGLVYTKMEDRFDEGEAHFSAAFDIYKDAQNRAIVCNNHADLLARKGVLILEEVSDLSDDWSDLVNAPVPTEKSGLMRMIQRGKTEAPTANAGKKINLLLDLSEVSKEAADVFKQADALRAKAYNFSVQAKSELTKKAAGKGDADKSQTAAVRSPEITYRSPAVILEELNAVVIGQMAAKRGLANAASQHLRRVTMSAEDRAKTDKSNVLIVGPTGCGKTLLAQALATTINVPFYRTSATKLTASGYVGEDVQSILVGLLRACDFDIERAQHGIIFLDEIDKLASHETGGEFDVRGKAVQEELLTIIEGTKISVPKDGNKKSSGEHVEMDTTNILFILGGAFSGLGEVIARRMASAKTKIGFGASLRDKDEDASSYVKFATAEDFIAFGMIPEFVGRLPKRLAIETLTVAELERILLEPKKALIPQKRFLLASTTDLHFTRGALRAIAEEAHKAGTNGRALLEIVEQVLEPIVFAEPEVAIVTAEMVLNRNAEIMATNRETTAVTAAAPAFIVDDDAVEHTREVATAAAGERRRIAISRTGSAVVPYREKQAR